MSAPRRKKSSLKKEADITPKHEIIRERIEGWYRYFEKNIKNHNGWKAFAFASTINGEDSLIYDNNQMPKFTVNMLEAYMSRIWGEFAKNTPDMSATPMSDEVKAEQVTVVEGYLRTILTSSEYSQCMNNTLRLQMAAAYGAQEVCLKYASPKTFEQEIEIIDIKDPTEVGFDPLAERYDKGDGDYSFRILRRKKKELQKEYPELDFESITTASFANGSIQPDNFDWNWWKGKDEIIRCYEFYEKVYEYVEILDVQMDPSNPYERKTMTRQDYNKLIDQIESDEFDYRSPVIKNSRKERIYKVVRFTGCRDFLFPPQNGGKAEDGEVTPFGLLPHVFFDNNSVDIDGRQCVRPFYYNAIDQQRLLDFAASNIVNDLDNMRPTDLFLSDQALPPEDSEWFEPYRNPAKSLGTMVYMKYDQEGKENQPPFSMSRNSVSESALAIFQMSIKAIQSILGCYDAQQGNMNEHDLSGNALATSVIQSNYASMPCIIRAMESVNQVARVVASVLPNIWVTKRTIPITNAKGEKGHITINDPTDPTSILANAYDPRDIGIYVKGSVNFDAQKDKAFKYITLLMKESPAFAEFINTVGMPMLLDNIDIRNITQIKEELKKFMQFKMKQALNNKNKPNPEIMKIENQEKEIKLRALIADEDARYKQGQLQLARIELFGKLITAQQEARVQLQKAQTEHERTIAQYDMDMANHNLDKFIKMNEHVLDVDKHYTEKREKAKDKAAERERMAEEAKEAREDAGFDEEEISENKDQGVDNII